MSTLANQEQNTAESEKSSAKTNNVLEISQEDTVAETDEIFETES